VESVSDKEVVTKGHEDEPLLYDFLILATGTSNYCKMKLPYQTEATTEALLRHAKRVESAKKILIVGAGAVGCEIAGEIADFYGPGNKSITLVSAHDKITPGPLMDKFRQEVVDQLVNELKVEIVLNERVVVPDQKDQNNDNDSNNNDNTIKKYTSASGREFEAYLVLPCTGNKVNNEYLRKNFADKLGNDGFLRVNPQLQVEGCSNIFAIGDLSNACPSKSSHLLLGQIPIVVANIKALAKNPKNNNGLKSYTAPKPMTALSLGRTHGVSQLYGIVFGSFLTRNLKSKALFIEKYWGEMNQKESTSKSASTTTGSSLA